MARTMTTAPTRMEEESDDDENDEDYEETQDGSDGEDDDGQVEQENKPAKAPAIVVPETSRAELLAMKKLLRDNPCREFLSKVDRFYYLRRNRKKFTGLRKDACVYDVQQAMMRNHHQTPEEREAEKTKAEFEAAIDEESWKEQFRNWLFRVRSEIPTCMNYRTAELYPCTCLNDHDPDMVIDIMYHIGKQGKGTRQTQFKQFITEAEQKKHVLLHIPDLLPEPTIFCRNTFRNLFTIRELQFKSLLQQIRKGNTGPNPNAFMGNKNRRKNSRSALCQDSVIEFIQRFAQENGQLIRTVQRKRQRNRTNREEEEEDENDQEMNVYHIPSHISKRGMYGAYVFENGFQKLRETSNGNYGRVDNYRKRKDDPQEKDWPRDQEPNTVCSYSSFGIIWEKHCSNVIHGGARRTVSSGDDTHYQPQLALPNDDSEDDDDDDEEEVVIVEEYHPPQPPKRRIEQQEFVEEYHPPLPPPKRMKTTVPYANGLREELEDSDSTSTEEEEETGPGRTRATTRVRGNRNDNITESNITDDPEGPDDLYASEKDENPDGEDYDVDDENTEQEGGDTIEPTDLKTYDHAAKLIMKKLLKENPFVKFLAKTNKYFYRKRQGGKKCVYEIKLKPDSESNTAAGGTDCTTCFPWEETFRSEFTNWLKRVKQEIPFCFCYGAMNMSQCTCIKTLPAKDIVALASFMVKQEKTTRQVLYKKFMVDSKSRKTVVVELPFLKKQMVLCKASFRNIFSIRDGQFATLRQQIKKGITGPQPSGMIGNSNRTINSAKAKCSDSVIESIRSFAQENGVPMLTGRRENNDSSDGDDHDDDDDDDEESVVIPVVLPKSCSKRGMYCMYVHNNGYQIPRENNGSYGAVSDYLKRKDDPEDHEWPSDREPNPVCSYASFCNIWTESCSDILLFSQVNGKK